VNFRNQPEAAVARWKAALQRLLSVATTRRTHSDRHQADGAAGDRWTQEWQLCDVQRSLAPFAKNKATPPTAPPGSEQELSTRWGLRNHGTRRRKLTVTVG
jgi:hypothetical protein